MKPQALNIKAEQNYLLVFFIMLYVTCKVVCNVLFFRQIELSCFGHSIKIVGSALIFPFIYILSDAIIYLSNKKTVIFVIIFGLICDCIFSISIYQIANFSIPQNMTSSELLLTQAANMIGIKMWQLFYQGLIASFIAAILEVIIFTKLYKFLKSFILSTITSVFITLLCHNIINDYNMLSQEDDVWTLIIDNLAINISIVVIYVLLMSALMKMKPWEKFYNLLNKPNKSV